MGRRRRTLLQYIGGDVVDDLADGDKTSLSGSCQGGYLSTGSSMGTATGVTASTAGCCGSAPSSQVLVSSGVTVAGCGVAVLASVRGASPSATSTGRPPSLSPGEKCGVRGIAVCPIIRKSRQTAVRQELVGDVRSPPKPLH